MRFTKISTTRQQLSLLFAALVTCSTACNPDSGEADKGGRSGDDTGLSGETGADGSEGSDGGDSGDTTGPCSTGWATLADPDAAIHVRTTGSDSGDGSLSAPFASAAAALEASHGAGGLRTLFFGPGEFPATLLLFDDGAGRTDGGLQLLGCGPEETTLAADDPLEPVIKVAGVGGVRLEGIRVAGGTRALWIWNGAEVVLAELLVEGSTRNGILVDGSETFVELEEVGVQGTLPDTSASLDGVAVGWGMAVQDGSVTWEGGLVSGSVGVGVFVDGATFTANNLSIEDTSTTTGNTLGRSFHSQDALSLSLTGGSLSGSTDAAIWSLRSYDLTLDGVEIGTVSAGTTPLGASTGDGLVISQGTGSTDPSTWWATVIGCSFEGPTRSAMLFDAVEVRGLEDNSVTDPGYSVDGVSVFLQNGAILSATSPDPALDLEGEGLDPLDFDPTALAREAL